MTTVVPTSRATIRLPAKLLKEIGRVVTVFSCIEHEIKFIIYGLLRVTPQEGRLAVREPRVRDSFEVIKSLVKIHGITVTHNIDALVSEISEMESIRDWLAHGVWTKVNGDIRLQITAGKWQPPGEKNGVRRKIIPSAALMTHQHIREIANVGKRLLAVCADLHKQVLVQQKSRPTNHSTGPVASGASHRSQRSGKFGRQKC